VTERAWTPSPACCWCDAPFIQQEIHGRLAFVCPSDPCRTRQLNWLMLDTDGVLFYLPLPKQVELEEAIASQQFGFICIGGDRAGGKSEALRKIAYRYCLKYPGFSVLLLRRTFPELVRNHVQKAQREVKRINAKLASYKVTFDTSDSILEFGHCQDDRNFMNYVGAEYDLVIYDQLEMFTEQQFTEINACAGRIYRPEWRGLALAGENPGGPMSEFINELFISKARDRGRFPDYDPSQYHFIPASLEDNAYIPKGYADFLAGLEPIKRDMYRFGRRDRYPGQYFAAFNQSEHVR
jgi:hypothetical protein